MNFTNKQLDSFIVLYEQQFDEKLTRAKALEQATALVSLVKLTYKPMTRVEWVQYSEHLRVNKNIPEIYKGLMGLYNYPDKIAEYKQIMAYGN